VFSHSPASKNEKLTEVPDVELRWMKMTYQEKPEKKMLSDPKIEVLIDANS
jgi:hypothetical protein